MPPSRVRVRPTPGNARRSGSSSRTKSDADGGVLLIGNRHVLNGKLPADVRSARSLGKSDSADEHRR